MDAFSAGVDLGGLKSKNDIKILICYILFSLKTGLSRENFVKILGENNLANYFEVNDAFCDLVKNNHIIEEENTPGSYLLTPSGESIASDLESALPIYIREKTLKIALNLIASIKREKENSAFVAKTKNGHVVNCQISGGEINLLELNLFVPDYMQGKMVKEKFLKDPEILYKCTLAILTNNLDLAWEILKDKLDSTPSHP